ncbi:MAG: DUF4845 domain-containing protein [Gammaproteobacteria bacterium]
MNRLHNKQTGITFIGLLLMAAIFGCFLLFGLRLFPLYNEHLQIKAAMTSTLNQPAEARSTSRETSLLFLKNAEINSVYTFSEANINDYLSIKKGKDGKKYLHMNYQNSKPLFKEVYLTVKTDIAMEIPESKN